MVPYLREQIERELAFWRKAEDLLQRAGSPSAEATPAIEAELKALEKYEGFWIDFDLPYARSHVSELEQRLSGGT